MKWSLIVPAAVGLLLAGAGGGWWWANRMQGQPATVEAKAADVLYWYDPMVPQQHFDKPGKSPFMDMELVPRYAEDAGPATGVQIAAGVQQNLGVRLAKVELVALAPRIDAAGVLGFNERDVAVVQSRANGFVEKVWRLAPGDRVRAGDPLVELLVPEWAAAEQEWLVVRQSGDASLLQVAHERLRLLGIDAVEIQRLEASGTAQSQFIVRAPISGVVQSLDVRAGMTLAVGQTLLRINGLDSVWMEVAVPEALAGNIRVGDRAEVHLADQGAATVEGRVGALLPALNDATRTLRVRVELINRLGRLRPGQSAQVTLIAGSSLDGLAVPTEAVIRTGKRALVMLAEKGGFRPVEVVLGQEVGDRTVIMSGLTEGQEVVASGQFLLDSEASLRGLGMPAMEEGQ
ncbi:MAG: efflux RND transporter periplasmic adaptor subunit [Pseudomonadota bacterium]|nr:efflux RND transporter periplasmic adaptor subunit [Pseudomonadota bacterium]